MTEQERIQHRAEVRAHLIEQDKRTAFMRHLYHAYGRNNPDHPLHGHYSGLPPQGQLIAIILILLFFITGYGIYMAFGPPNKNLTDPWDKHED